MNKSLAQLRYSMKFFYFSVSPLRLTKFYDRYIFVFVVCLKRNAMGLMNKTKIGNMYST